jgi:hypothetical protein
VLVEYQMKTAALERKLGELTTELDLLKKQLRRVSSAANSVRASSMGCRLLVPTRY